MRNPLKPLTAALGRAFARPHETKKSRTGSVVSLHLQGAPVWTPRNYEALAREGFSGNAVGYRCVRMIAEAAASVPWALYQGAAELGDHPLLALLARPNGAQGGGDLFELFYAQLQTAGNAYLEAVLLDGEVRELHALRPDRMKVVPGPDGWPEAFDYSANGRSVRFAQTGEPVPILHLKLINPAGDYYGLSPFEAAAKAIDIHNAAGAWNKALLDNGARPSGALVYKGGDQPGANLTEEQYATLRAELAESYQGSANAGRPMVLEGGLEWAAMSHSPRELDFIEAKHVAAREIALAFGVPPMLLGIPGDNTFANYAEANRTFWRQTVLPLVGRTAGALSQWLGPAYGGDLRLWFDADKVEALAGEREALWARVGAAEFLSADEKREAVGYGAEE
ncbi:MAG: phage portal protein [Alphaproteobacteria bacterium]|nr:phage portal protein [Alphaproteobacteria bacterium]